jgi:hypothetical protein
MEGLMDLLQGDLGKTLIQGMSRETGQPEGKTGELLQMALPVLLGAMQKNTRSKDGADGLLNALNNKHDGSILDNIGTLFDGGYTEEVRKDGAGILGHIIGDKESLVTRTLGNKVGMDSSDVGRILQMAAPILLGFLGRQQRSVGVESVSGLEGMLGNLMGSDTGKQSMIEAFLDSDGDGSVVDDLAGMLLKDKGKGGLGGLLGGFLGK